MEVSRPIFWKLALTVDSIEENTLAKLRSNAVLEADRAYGIWRKNSNWKGGFRVEDWIGFDPSTSILDHFLGSKLPF